MMEESGVNRKNFLESSTALEAAAAISGLPSGSVAAKSNSKDIEYHKAILARGVSIAFDRIGLDIITPFEVNLRNVVELCKLGFTEKIILSHDTTNVWLGRPPVWPERVRKLYANWHIGHVSKDFIPALKAQGISDEQIKIMMVENPRRLFRQA